MLKIENYQKIINLNNFLGESIDLPYYLIFNDAEDAFYLSERALNHLAIKAVQVYEQMSLEKMKENILIQLFGQDMNLDRFLFLMDKYQKDVLKHPACQEYIPPESNPNLDLWEIKTIDEIPNDVMAAVLSSTLFHAIAYFTHQTNTNDYRFDIALDKKLLDFISDKLGFNNE